MPTSDSLCAEEVSLLRDTQFDVTEFSQRWLRARRAAILLVIGSSVSAALEEERLLLQEVRPDHQLDS